MSLIFKGHSIRNAENADLEVADCGPALVLGDLGA